MPGDAPRFYPFWSVNAPLVDARLVEQLEAFAELGFAGVVFHPRFYPDRPPYLSPEYFAHVRDLILATADLGLDFWLYDENGWPSGTVGGTLFDTHPEAKSRIAAAFGPDDPVPAAGRLLGTFAWAGADYRLCELPGEWLDYLNPDATAHFFRAVLDVSYQSLGDTAWQHVQAVFTDEPQLPTGMWDALPHGAVPWTPGLAAAWRDRGHGDLLAAMPQIFFGDDTGADIRCAFRELLVDLLNAAWYVPYRDWCAAHGIAFTGHVKGEESPLFQVPFTGSLAQTVRHLHIPGLDALERHLGNGFFPRQVAGLGVQFGDGRSMAECCGGAGWGATPADYVRYLGALRHAGITDFVLHQSQYCLHGAGIADWPPSVPLHVGWYEAWPEIFRRVRALPPPPVPDRLLVAPVRRVMADFRPADVYRLNPHDGAPLEDTPLTEFDRDFLALADRCDCYHVTDEAVLEAFARLEDGAVRLGNAAYRELIVPPGCCFQAAGKALVAACREAGLVHPPPDEPAVTVHAPSLAAGFETFAVAWAVRPVPDNRLRLAGQDRGNGCWRTVFQCQQPMDLELGFADRVHDVTINGVPADPEHGWEADTYSLHGLVRAGRNVVDFQCDPAALEPFAWLAGAFRVLGREPFRPGPNGTVRTLGPFAVHEWHTPPDARDLLVQGLPFCLGPVEIDTELELTEERRFHVLALGDVHAAAAQVFLDGEELGWAWAPDWQVDIAVHDFLPGVHRFGCRLIPSAYNFYGPHHYRLGDNPLISPEQYLGARNFVDPPDSPSATHVPDWHFVPFGLGPTLRFLPAL